LYLYKKIKLKCSNEADAKILLENICQMIEKLVEFENELVKQKPLSDSTSVLNKQQADFVYLKNSFTKKAPHFNDSINKVKEFYSKIYHENNKLREDLINYSNEANFKFKMVNNININNNNNNNNNYN
jgi:hypothetical protein